MPGEVAGDAGVSVHDHDVGYHERAMAVNLFLVFITVL